MFAEDQRASPTSRLAKTFSSPTLASAEKVRAKSPAASKSARELQIPKSPSARLPSDASTRANQRSSPSTARKTIASFLAEARAEATSPSNAAATSPSGRRWSAPLPPPSPGTPSVFGRDARGSPSADVRTLGGNPLTAVNVAAHLGVGVLPSAAGRGYSGAVFGNLLRREEAASVVKFREMAVMRERIRADAVRGAGANDDAARAEIARLQKQVHALVADIDRFRGEEKMAEVVVDADRREDGATREDRGETSRRVGDENAEPADASRRAPEANLRATVPHASSARSLLRDVLSDAAAKASEYYPSDAEFLSDASRDERRDASSRPASRPNSRVAFSSPARSERSDRSGRYLRTTRRDTEEARYRRGLSPHSGGAPREFWGEGRGAVQGGANDGAYIEGGVEGADIGGAEGAEGGGGTRGAEGGTQGVLGPATLGVLGPAALAPFARDAAYVAGAAAALEAAAAAHARDRDRDREKPTASQVERERAAEETGRLREANRHLRRELGVAQRLMTGYHAQLMTGGVGARGLLPPPRRARNSRAPSYRERRAHPPFAHPFPPRVDGSRGSGEEFSFRVDDVGPGDARDDDTFEFDVGDDPIAEFDVGGVPRASPSVASLGAPTHSAHRAQSKRRAAELATLRAERAFAEAAVATDGLETIRLAEEVRKLKAIVAGLVRSANFAGERRREDAEKVTIAGGDDAGLAARKTDARERSQDARRDDDATPGSTSAIGRETPVSIVSASASAACDSAGAFPSRAADAATSSRETPVSAFSASASAGASLSRTPTQTPTTTPTTTPTHAPTPVPDASDAAGLSPSEAPAMDVSLTTDAEAFFRRADDADESVSASVAVGSDDDDTAEVR